MTQGVLRSAAEGASSPDSEPRPFPVFGVLLVAAILVTLLIRRAVAEAVDDHVVVLACAVVLDVGFLTWLSKRRAWRSAPAARSALIVLGVNAVVCMLFALGVHFSLLALGLSRGRTLNGRAVTIQSVLIRGAVANLLLYAVWILGFRYPELARSAERQRAEAARERDRAELTQLRAHLQPHFLRNTLNAIAALVVEDPRQARRLLATLGEMLTDALQDTRHEHTIDEELTWLDHYAALLEARYHGAIAFVWDVADSTRSARIPTLLLQPLVENAALHGALGRDGDGQVVVRVKPRQGGGVEIAVEDNGPGFDPALVRPEMLGLRLVRRRLDIERSGSTFEIESSARGTRAVVGLT